MKNLIRILGLEEICEQTGLLWEGRNFEDFYSELSSMPQLGSHRIVVENAVSSYFSGIELPEEPTIYDYIVLSLREKDMILTFNWDPLLAQAKKRNSKIYAGPQIAYLHGCVSRAYRKKGDGTFDAGNFSVGAKPLPSGWTRMPLLYPVTKKDYQSDPFISHSWSYALSRLQECRIFTIFGYSAPESDVEAIELLKKGWGRGRTMEDVEIIEKPDMTMEEEKRIFKKWKTFIHETHYEIYNSYFKSSLAKTPRRTHEAFIAEKLDILPVEPNRAPALGTVSLSELQEWHKELILREAPENEI